MLSPPLTEDSAEKAMPCFSGDGKAVYFTRYAGKIGAVCRLDLQTHEETVIFSEPDVNAYYPIAKDGLLYFTKWYSAENHCDQLMCFDGGTVTALPFTSADHDCSDACPAGSRPRQERCAECGGSFPAKAGSDVKIYGAWIERAPFFLYNESMTKDGEVPEWIRSKPAQSSGSCGLHAD